MNECAFFCELLHNAIVWLPQWGADHGCRGERGQEKSSRDFLSRASLSLSPHSSHAHGHRQRARNDPRRHRVVGHPGRLAQLERVARARVARVAQLGERCREAATVCHAFTRTNTTPPEHMRICTDPRESTRTLNTMLLRGRGDSKLAGGAAAAAGRRCGETWAHRWPHEPTRIHNNPRESTRAIKNVFASRGEFVGSPDTSVTRGAFSKCCRSL